MDDKIKAKLLVMDTGPLITLSLAGCLDYLLYPGIPIYIPDAVVFEAINDDNALGAQEILDWLQKYPERVHAITTQVFMNYVAQGDSGFRREKDLGERAAIEVLSDAIHLGAGERAMMMTEDNGAIRRLSAGEPELDVIALTTRDFLDALEQEQRIQSADQVYALAKDRGRTATQRKALEDKKHAASLEAVRNVMRRDGGPDR